ncbi:hypothetical protein J3F83DRAFT_740791 [Trichoderma novae-zelandiae]
MPDTNNNLGDEQGKKRSSPKGSEPAASRRNKTTHLCKMTFCALPTPGQAPPIGQIVRAFRSPPSAINPRFAHMYDHGIHAVLWRDWRAFQLLPLLLRHQTRCLFGKAEMRRACSHTCMCEYDCTLSGVCSSPVTRQSPTLPREPVSNAGIAAVGRQARYARAGAPMACAFTGHDASPAGSWTRARANHGEDARVKALGSCQAGMQQLV